MNGDGVRGKVQGCCGDAVAGQAPRILRAELRRAPSGSDRPTGLRQPVKQVEGTRGVAEGRSAAQELFTLLHRSVKDVTARTMSGSESWAGRTQGA
jgi:hypothetical protein